MSMKDVEPLKELYLGCECMDLDHISHLLYFPPTEKEKEDGEEEIIYFNFKFTNYFDHFLPPIRYFYDKSSWGDYLYHNHFRKVIIGLKYIFNRYYNRKYGILSCFEFQNKDLSKLDIFLSQITNNVDTVEFGKNINHQSTQLLDNEKWLIRISIGKQFHDNKFPYQLGWDPQFIHCRNIFGRIKYALKYIFGKYCDVQCFEIKEIDASKLRGMIKWIQDTNYREELEEQLHKIEEEKKKEEKKNV